MEARIVSIEGDGESCFCLGVIDISHRSSSENSKRLCMADTLGGLDVAVDLADSDVASLIATLSGGLLAIYQRAGSIP
jgi:hypothetical protein